MGPNYKRSRSSGYCELWEIINRYRNVYWEYILIPKVIQKRLLGVHINSESDGRPHRGDGESRDNEKTYNFVAEQLRLFSVSYNYRYNADTLLIAFQNITNPIRKGKDVYNGGH